MCFASSPRLRRSARWRRWRPGRARRRRGRGVEECLEDARGVASHGGGDVRVERGADVEDESAGERGEAVGAEGGEEAAT